MSRSFGPEGDLADFLATWTRRPRWQFAGTGGNRTLRSAEELARDLLDDTEFAEIRLAKWLCTPEGKVIETAVAHVLPWPESAEFQLLVEAVTLAAKAKQRGQIRLAAALTLIAGCIGVALARPLLHLGNRGHGPRSNGSTAASSRRSKSR